jgi:hypothetical protein
LRKRYERLVEREDAWIMEVRRLTLPQVTLYFGAWILAVGAALLTFFRSRNSPVRWPCGSLGGDPADRVDRRAHLAQRLLSRRHRVPAGVLPAGAGSHCW